MALPSFPQYGVILDAASLGSDINLGPITATLEHWQSHATTSPGDTAERIKNCSLVVTNKVVIDAELMAQNPQLKLICIAATGTNNIDLVAAKKYGICVKNAVNYSTTAVAQHTFSLILALSNQLNHYHHDVRTGNWSQSPFFCLLDHPIIELNGKTLGLIGYGNAGKAVAKIATAFGMELLISQRPGSSCCPHGRAPLLELLRQSDIVSLHCPLADNTRHLIGSAELQQMKESALLINCARGGIVDESALLAALKQGEITGAALDVLEQEPPAINHPLLLLQQELPNLLLTPHIAWASVAARQRLVAIVAKNISDYLMSNT